MKILLILLSILFNAASTGSIKDETEALIREKLGDSVTAEFIKYQIPQKLKKEIETETRQRFYGEFVYIYKINKEGKLKNIVIVDNVYGKSMPITFMVIFENDGKINYSGIIKYREQYGGGVQSDEWNEQFINKDSKSGYEVGKDISAISGATISANSVSRGIKKLAVLIEKIKNEL